MTASGWLRSAWHVARMGRSYEVLVVKPDGSTSVTSFLRRTRKWQNRTKAVLNEIVWEGVNWIELAQDRMHLPAVVYMEMEHILLQAERLSAGQQGFCRVT